MSPTDYWPAGEGQPLTLLRVLRPVFALFLLLQEMTSDALDRSPRAVANGQLL